MGIDLLAHDRDVCVVWELGITCTLYHTCLRIGTSMALKVNESKIEKPGVGL